MFNDKMNIALPNMCPLQLDYAVYFCKDQKSSARFDLMLKHYKGTINMLNCVTYRQKVNCFILYVHVHMLCLFFLLMSSIC